MKKRIFSLFIGLATILSLFSLVSCGSKTAVKDTGSSASSGEATKDTADEYYRKYLETYDPLQTAESYAEGFDPAEHDFEGHEFKFLNSAPIYYMYIYLDPDMTGDVLDDCCFERNFIAEQFFDITISEETQPFDSLAGYAKTLILTGEDVYDAMYIPAANLTPMISENLFVDLLEIEELNIDRIWWDQPMIERNIIENRLFYATSDLSLMAFEGIWCMYFNEDMMNQLGLDYPYKLAMENKWTFDAMKQYLAAAANLNGDSSFTFSLTGNATYGLVSLDRAPMFMAYGMETEFVTRDNNGRYQFTADTNPKFTDTWEKLITLWGENNGLTVFHTGSKDLDPDGYYGIFEANRALFLSAELKGATMLREWEGNFGLMPQPKYDESQEYYNSTLFNNCLSFCIPNTNVNLERTGIIVDYLTYMSYTNLLPRYYDIHVSLKALGKQESIDVLSLIRGTRGIEVSIPFCWSTDLFNAMYKLCKNNEHAISSTVEKYKDSIVSAIDDTYNNYPVLDSVKKP